MNSGFSRLSPESKAKMRTVIQSWKRTKSGIDILTEGLQVLASPNRESAMTLIKEGSAVADFICGYGKGTRPKLSLDKRDAILLLEVLSAVKDVAQDDPKRTAELLDTATSVLLNGTDPGSLDRSYDPLIKKLTKFHPKIGQQSLFS